MAIRHLQDLNEVLHENIKNLKENEQIDFKRQWYEHNELMLHDILCFANTLHNYECFIIIGIDDNGELFGVNGDPNRKKQVKVIDYVASINFAGDCRPNIAVDTLKIEDKEVDVITIFNSFYVPFYVRKKKGSYEKIKEEFIYTRTGDRNSSISRNSDYKEIEALWGKRFLLKMPAMDQIRNRLGNQFEWMEKEGGYYNIYKPEFQICINYPDVDHSESLNRGEFYVFSQTNSQFQYGTLELKYNHTVLQSIQVVLLDGGRFRTATPKWEFLDEPMPNLTKPLYAYKYFLEDSVEFQLQRFLFNSRDSEEVIAKRKLDRVILYFKNGKEQQEFNSFILKNKMIMQELLEAEEESFNWLDSNEISIGDKIKLRTGLALNKALAMFRLEA